MAVRKRQTLLLILAIIAFGVLMGIRGEFHSIWLRAGLAACAFTLLAAAISHNSQQRGG